MDRPRPRRCLHPRRHIHLVPPRGDVPLDRHADLLLRDPPAGHGRPLRHGRAVVVGTRCGLIGAVAYDIFRLPFVFSHAWGLDASLGVPQMPLFKVFPRFGALILGQPVEQTSYSLRTNLLGWAYHFSNGAAFGVMFAALIGVTTRLSRGGWPWAVLLAM